MRILWVGNAPWSPSGYGEQTALFAPRLRDLGHDVAIAANYGLQGMVQEWRGIPVYPADGDWNNRALGAYVEHHRADLVIVLHDAWPMRPDEWEPGPPVAIWTPVDHYPIPPAVLGVVRHERIRPIAMSQFGFAQMKTFQLDPLYVPHGVDTSVFRPQPDIRADVRRELGIPENAFLVGMVAANKGSPQLPRKAFPQVFDAFRRFRMANPEVDSWLYVHSDALPLSAGTGINLSTLAHVLGLQDCVRFPPPNIWHLPISNDTLAHLYQAFDVLANPSMGEGFGIPVLEAQACGIPVITSNHSAMPELTRAGWLVEGDPWWDPLQDSFFIVPFIDSIAAALEDAYNLRGSQELRELGAAFAADYAADVVTEKYWRPALDALAAPTEVAPLVLPNRAARRRARKTKVA